MSRRLGPSPVTIVLAAAVLTGTLYVGARPVGGAPAFGPLLDPVHGVWALARTATPPADATVQIPSLADLVEVRFDDRGVPHIFATSLTDAARAMGYVHARDRLFQMELQARAVAGTVAELVGDRAVAVDREARAQGLAAFARRGYEALGPQSAGRTLTEAYAQGVNAYIDAMTDDDIPFEFRLLGARPQRWEPVYTAYLFARMGLTLAYSEGELRRGAIEALVGRDAADALFPRDNPIQEPIQPNGQHAARMDFRKVPPPARPDSAKLTIAMSLLESARTLAEAANEAQLDDVAVGSNNWAVSPRRTAAGNALLAGDPHLALTLPSIWYQAQIVVPDTLDVYGVTIPGAPIPPIGFNRDVAWSETNTGADVADYFVETVDDSTHPTRYRVDGAWRALTYRVEAIRGKGGRVISTDTIRESHRGSMLHAGGQWISRRWTINDGDDITGPFLGAARSKSVKELWEATNGFFAPAQNFVSADRGGHIAIRSTGHFPVRGRGAVRGDLLLDGSKSASDWQGWWKLAEYPQAYDPPQGFVVSANQQPKDPRVDPRYIGWDWPSPWRAIRINEMLRADSAITPDAMRRIQTTPVSAQTKYFLPMMVEADATGRDSSFSNASRLLRDWDGTFDADNRAAVLYETTLAELAARTWDELRAGGTVGEPLPRRVDTPQNVILLQLMQDPSNPWWDDQRTPDVRERRDDIIRASVLAAYRTLVQRLGQPGDTWRWGLNRRASVRHLGGIAALGRPNVPVTGGPGSVSPSSGDGNHGASWRMVVELGDEVRGWGVYPGGQSGNPISPRYTDLLDKWSAGTLDSLPFPRTAADLPTAKTSSRLLLKKAP